MNRRQVNQLLKTARDLDVSYLYPLRGRQLLRNAPFAHVRVE
jgi:hypothetical protein